MMTAVMWRPRSPVAVAIAALVAFATVGAACSSSDDDSGPTTVTLADGAGEGALPIFTGEDVCEDAQDDLLDANSTVDLPAPQVPGIDLVRASVTVQEDVLAVEYETVGTPSPLDRPRFSVSKGIIGETGWFELRAAQGDGGWRVTLHQLGQPTGGTPGVERVDEVGVPVTVTDNVVRIEVPTDTLPDITTSPTWQYGSRAEAPAPAFDECTPFSE